MLSVDCLLYGCETLTGGGEGIEARLSDMEKNERIKWIDSVSDDEVLNKVKENNRFGYNCKDDGTLDGTYYW